MCFAHCALRNSYSKLYGFFKLGLCSFFKKVEWVQRELSVWTFCFKVLFLCKLSEDLVKCYSLLIFPGRILLVLCQKKIAFFLITRYDQFLQLGINKIISLTTYYFYWYTSTFFEGYFFLIDIYFSCYCWVNLVLHANNLFTDSVKYGFFSFLYMVAWLWHRFGTFLFSSHLVSYVMLTEEHLN